MCDKSERQTSSSDFGGSFAFGVSRKVKAVTADVLTMQSYIARTDRCVIRAELGHFESGSPSAARGAVTDPHSARQPRPGPSQPETGTKHPTQGEDMAISPEIREKVANELKQFVGNLNLSDEQQEKLRGFLGEAHEKVEEYRKQNPNATKEDLVRNDADN